MSSPLDKALAGLCSIDSSTRSAAAAEICRNGRAPAAQATSSWWRNLELSRLMFAPNPVVTVGLAVERSLFARIHEANGAPPLAQVPPDQDAEECELDFSNGVALDVLTTRAPGGPGAVARFLAKFGEGVQQVEFRCSDVDRATTILKEALGVMPVYPNTRSGANGTRVNFFLVPTADKSKVLIELYQLPGIAP